VVLGVGGVVGYLILLLTEVRNCARMHVSASIRL
jgi:hypothetical protein